MHAETHAERTGPLDRVLTWITAGLVTAILLGPAVFLALFVVLWNDSDRWLDSGASTGTACSRVLAFAGGSLPAQATGASCTDDGAWQVQGCTAEFRMPREELAARLTAAFPRVRLDHEDTAGLSFGNAHEANGSRPRGQAMEVHLKAAYQPDGTALVELRAFDT
ncbi:hypothetical protein ACFRMQ_30715 [Kitasatospora sp. NPDC056783]|uniref:hypothetical protein n=1 Tax=Kitasatospora sp. NPDC056783 TaxID=3345943 RepID=UPI00367A060A